VSFYKTKVESKEVSSNVDMDTATRVGEMWLYSSSEKQRVDGCRGSHG
jgi:hypothetical protein